MKKIIKMEDIMESMKLKKRLDETARETLPGATLIDDLPDYDVYRITDKEAAIKYGRHSKWCISTEDSNPHATNTFDRYTELGYHFWFFMVKNSRDKYVLFHHSHDRIGTQIITIPS